MNRHIFVVQTNAIDGEDDAYNHWHTNIHLPDALAVPGFVAAQRFKLSETQRPGAELSEYRYLTIYEMDGDPGEALAALRESVPGMHISPSMAPDRVLNVFEAITG
jgi:hypothetical protein